MPPDSPRVTVFAIGMTTGLLLALVAHMLSGRVGIGLTGIWQDLFPTDANAVRSALGWWLIAGAGFAGSFAAARLAQEATRSPGRPHRLPWLLAALMFGGLAAAPYLAVSLPVPNLPFAIGAHLAAFGLGTVTAFCGSWFALPR